MGGQWEMGEPGVEVRAVGRELLGGSIELLASYWCRDLCTGLLVDL